MRHHLQDVRHNTSSPRLHVVAVVSNPIGYHSRYALFRRFVEHVSKLDVHLVLVEQAHSNRDFAVTTATNPNHVQVRSDSILWVKESLINAGVRALPRDWEYVAWVDADVEFLNKHWVEDTLHELQVHRVVQLFDTTVDLGPRGEVLHVHKSFTSQLQKQTLANLGFYSDYGKYDFAHPGYGWATRRSVWDGLSGMIDFSILGSADHHAAWAFAGDVTKSAPPGMNKNYLEALHIFQERADAVVQKKLGTVQGTLAHAWHGRKADRRYVDRWKILTKHNYDPLRDITRDAYGVVKWAGNKPELERDVLSYFMARNEDSVDTASSV